MAYILEKWNTSTETWDDLSTQAEKLILDLNLDIFGVREIEYQGQTLILDDGTAIANGDYIRYGTDGPVNNYRNMIKGINSDMSSSTGHDWIAGLGNPTFDINVTYAGKMTWQYQAAQAEEIELDLPGVISPGVTYRIKVYLRTTTGTENIKFGCGWGSFGDSFVEFSINTTETLYEDTFVGADGHDGIFYIYNSSVNNDGEVRIDDLKLYVESEPVLFSGKVSDLFHLHKKGKYEFDLINDIGDLKNYDITRFLTGSNLRERLMDGIPSGYCLVEMDSIAEVLLDMDQTGLTTMTYPGDQVVGTDSNIYTCKKSHSADATNRPVTGGNWATYWEQFGVAGETWAADETYNAGKFGDLLYDTLLISNADTFGNALLYCVVINKELRMYGVSVIESPSLISDQYVEECEEALTQELIEVLYHDNIWNDLKGTAHPTWGIHTKGEWLVSVHKLMAAYEKELMNLTGVARPGGGTAIYGFVTSIMKEGSMFTYELTYLEIVT